MKKVLTAIAFLAALASCTVDNTVQEGQPAHLRVGVKYAASVKGSVSGTDDEKSVHSLQVFVFRMSQGKYILEASVKEDSGTAGLTVTTGQKHVLVLANEPADYSDAVSRDAILEKVSRLKDNAPDSFVMIGEADCLVSSLENTLAVPVDRMASRVKIHKITNKLRNGFASKDVKVSRVFLTGAGASATYSAKGNTSGFYATSGINGSLDLDGTQVGSDEKTSVNALIYKEVLSGIIPEEGSYTAPVSLYAYPNDGSANATQLTVEMEIGGKYYTYPIVLPAMGRNCTCEVTELVLSSLGNASNGDDSMDPGEDNPISFMAASFNVSVSPWTEVNVSNGEDGKYTI